MKPKEYCVHCGGSVTGDERACQKCIKFNRRVSLIVAVILIASVVLMCVAIVNVL